MNIRRILFIVISATMIALLFYPVYLLQDYVPGETTSLETAEGQLALVGRYLAGEKVDEAYALTVIQKATKIKLDENSTLYQLEKDGLCWELHPTKSNIPYKIPC